MGAKLFLKFRSGLSMTAILAAVIFSILIFQNCGRIVLSHKEESQSASSVFTARDIDANDILDTMTSAKIKDSNVFNETLDLSADTMTCGVKVGATTTECQFKKVDEIYTTSNGSAVNVKNYLNNIGIALDCPSCNDSESYTVRNISCVKDPKFPREATCTFTR